MISSSASNEDDLVLHFPGVISPSEFRLDLSEGVSNLAGEMVVTRRSLVNVVRDGHHLSHLIFVSVSNLEPFSVLSCSGGFDGHNRDEDVNLNVELSDNVLVHIKIEPEDRRRLNPNEAHCLAWDQFKSRWDPTVCSRIVANGTHVSCSCSRLTRFTIGVGGATNSDFNYQGDKTTAFSDVNVREESVGDVTFTSAMCVAIASSILVVTILGFVFIVVYCRRIKVK